jgi:MFS family permease
MATRKNEGTYAGVEKEGPSMSSKKVGGDKSLQWEAMASGWAMAVLTATLIDPALSFLYRLFVELPTERGELDATVVVISVVSGFISYLVGGYIAARMAPRSGGKHGALTAVFGLIIGIILMVILGLFSFVFAEGFPVLPMGFGLADVVPPASFGLSGAALTAGSVLFLANLFGGFVGGELGEPSYPDIKRFG